MQLALPPSLVNIRARVARYVASLVPLSRRTIINPLVADQPLTASQLDVSTVHAILDGTDAGNTNEYFALCELMIISDNHLQGELRTRKLAILGDEKVISPVDKKNPDDVKAADAIREMVNNLPSFLEACGWLLDGALWPLAVVEKVYRPATVNLKLSYEVDKLIQVPPRLFDYSTGSLRIWDTDPVTGSILNTKSDPLPMRYLTHRAHLLSTPDYRGGPMRSLIFWWLFSQFDRDWWARFLDRYGAPFLVGKYDQADDDSRIVLENAFSLAAKIGGIVISRQTEVELKEAMSKSGGEGFELFHKVCQREKSKLIIGQTGSEDEHKGMGSGGVAKQKNEVRGDIRQFDSMWLGNTLRYQLFDPFLAINRIRGRAKISWGTEQAEDIVQKSSAVKSLSDAGIEVTDDGLETLSSWMGLPLQRKKVEEPPPPGGPRSKKIVPLNAQAPDFYSLADQANSAVARVGAPRLARAFRGAFAPVAQFITESSGPDELITKISTHYADWAPDKLAPIILEALSAQAANGAARDVAE